MTRDEAKAKLNEVIEWSKLNRYPYADDRDIEAIKVAIKALEQQTCEDAISRQAVEEISRFDPLEPYNSDYVRGFIYGHDRLLNEIRKLPSVNPQRIGHWIQTEEKDDAEPRILWKCSCCHKEFRSVVHKVSNYCPSCGAKMVEPQESEDKEDVE